IGLKLELSGRRAILFFRYQRLPAEKTYTQFEDKPTFEEVDVLANRYIEEYVSGRVDRVDVAYMKFIRASEQRPVVETLLPLSAVAPEVRQAAPEAKPAGPAIEYEFLPGAQDILQ